MSDVVRTSSASSEAVVWNRQHVKDTFDKYIDQNTQLAAKTIKSALPTFVAILFDTIAKLFFIPITVAVSLKDQFSGKIVEKCDPLVDKCAQSSSDAAKSAMHQSVDKSGDAYDSSRNLSSSKWFWSK